MLKLPYGISNYEELVQDRYYYADKTSYIEKLENLPEKRIMFLRPRKFGKTLFTSTLENYYDIKKADKFENLFGNTYIGKHPTELKNSYHILKFNFSGINTKNEETTMKGFKERVAIPIQGFVQKYNLDFYVNWDLTAEGLLSSLIETFKTQRPEEKIYVIIDEYDHFANELLSFNTSQFKTLLSKNGKVRKWYEILKEGTESVIDRIFITGVAPITLDSLTSGFNIGSDKTQNAKFNEMMGFTKEELIQMMEDIGIEKKEQEELLPIMKENYDGYKFSVDATEKLYNSNMCLFFLNSYIDREKIPEKLIDTNIASDYNKLGNMLDLCVGEERARIIEETIAGEGIVSEITEKFNPAIEFEEKELVSMLFYLGYLTIAGEEIGTTVLKVPNKVMRELYSEYFMKLLSIETDLKITNEYTEIRRGIALEGKIDKIIEIMEEFLKRLSNRDYIKFDEKNIKIMFYTISSSVSGYVVKSEMEVERKYPDILLIPKDRDKGYKSIMIEFKYLKKDEENKLQEKQGEARKQIEEYAELEEIKEIQNLYKYTVVAVNDRLYVEEI